MEDESEPGFAKGVVEKNIIPKEEYIAKVRAAKAALEGTDCIFIARTNVLINTEEGFADAIDRCRGSLEAGADMLLINQLKTMNAADLYPLGFNLVTMHFMMKGSMVGMLNYALRVAEEQNNIYPRDDMPYNISGQNAQPFYPVQEWLDLEESFSGIHNTFWGDKPDLTKR